MMERLVMQIFPMAAGFFRDAVLLGMLIVLWKKIVSKTTDMYDICLFAAVGIALAAGDLADVGAAVRFPLIGIGITACCVYRKKSGAPKIVFLLLLLYNIHVLTYLIASCFYDLLNEIAIINGRMDVNAPYYMNWLYSRLAAAQLILMLTYALLTAAVIAVFKKIAGEKFDMGIRDFFFLSVLNVVGIIFAYMIIGLSVVKLETDVFMLFDERKDALWKVPLMSFLMLAGEMSSIYVWQRYRALMAEQESVLIYEGKLKQIKERLDEADSFYGNIRALKHDIRNHISNIQNLNAKGDFESADAYIEKIDRALDEMDYKYSTGNSVCDVIVNDKYRICVRENIDFSCDFSFCDRAGVASFDMGIILSNLLDNAIEACRKVEDGRRFIRLKSKIKGAFVLVEISNSYVGGIVFDGDSRLPVSTKQAFDAPAGSDLAASWAERPPGAETGASGEAEAAGPAGADRTDKTAPPAAVPQLHGIGLKSSRQVAEKYMGNLKIETADETFTAVVMLQMRRPVDTL